MTIQIISLSIAFIAVIVGPIITYKMMKKKFEFHFISMVHGKWIDKLEDNVITYLNNTVQWIEKYPGLVEKGKNNPLFLREVNDNIDRMLDEINVSIIRLQLLLDTKSRDQKEILNNVIIMKDIINSKDYDENSIIKLRNAHEIIIDKVKKVFTDKRNAIVKIYKK